MGIFRNRGSDNSSSNNNSGNNSGSGGSESPLGKLETGETEAEYALRAARLKTPSITEAVANATTGGGGAQTGGRREGDDARTVRRHVEMRSQGRRI